MALKVDIKSLKRRVDEEVHLSPSLSPDNAFVFWFMQALLTSDPQAAKAAIVGGANDKGVDALYFDHENHKVFIVQGKYHATPKAPTEGRSDVIGLPTLARTLHGTKTELDNLVESASPMVRERLTEAHRLVHKKNYTISLYYVTTGSVSAGLQAEAEGMAEANDAELHVIDRSDALHLLHHWLTTDSRPIPFLDLPIEESIGNSMIERKDDNGAIRSWVFAMLGSDVGKAYEKAGDRIFAKNIRGFLGKGTDVNDSIRHTLQSAPEHFWYFNNGITFVCDNAAMHGHTLRVFNPQIINGQQTSRTLKEFGTSKASVLVRVIAIESDTESGDSAYEALVSDIVAATNYQNQIFPSDLRSNDAEQVRIEREFRRLNYSYIRKRRGNEEVGPMFKMSWRFTVSKEDVAKAVAACELDPVVVRSGKEQLFEGEHYKRIFSGRPAKEYLTFVWLGRWVRWGAHGKPSRGYARWVVLNFTWKHVRALIGHGEGREKFLRMNAENYELPNLWGFINQAYNAALAFHRKNSGKGAQAADVSTFFKHSRLDDQFASFWLSSANMHRSQAMKYLKRFEEKDLSEFEIE
jgi:hypothetical protein